MDVRPESNSDGVENIQDTLEPGALPLCLGCLQPAAPLQYYCDKCACDDAINPLTPYIGFVNIRFNYGLYCTLWRRLWHDRNMKIWLKFFSLLIIMFFPFPLLLVGLVFIAFEKDDDHKLAGPTEKVIWLVALVLAVLRLMFFIAYI